MNIKIGTRKSKLALNQAQLVIDKLQQNHNVSAEIVSMNTSGDRITDKPLADFGGKGLFTKEIEESLISGDIDIAVHSLKDVPTFLPEGLEISCVLEREDPRDAFLSEHSLHNLPEASTIGTCSLRRKAQILTQRPDLEILPFRGNVDTRIKKLNDKVVDGTILALCGLKRLGRENEVVEIFSPEVLLPAVGQGVIAVQTRADDKEIKRYLEPLNHRDTHVCMQTERSFLRILEGSCKTPIGGLATVNDGIVSFKGILAYEDGTRVFSTSKTGPVDQASSIGEQAAYEILDQINDNDRKCLFS